MEEKVKAFLELATQKKASDIFIIAGRPLSVKIDGKLCTLDGFEERLMPPETDEFIRIIYKLAHDRNIEPMLETGDDDFSMAIPGLSRFRVNTYRQRGSLAAVIRIIAFNLPDPQPEYHLEAVLGILHSIRAVGISAVIISGSQYAGTRRNQHAVFYYSQALRLPRRRNIPCQFEKRPSDAEKHPLFRPAGIQRFSGVRHTLLYFCSTGDCRRMPVRQERIKGRQG